MLIALFVFTISYKNDVPASSTTSCEECQSENNSGQNDDGDQNDDETNSPNTGTELKGWEIGEIDTGLAGVGLTEDDLSPLDLTSGEDAGKGKANYSGVTGYIYANQTIENKKITYSYQLDLTAGGYNLALETAQGGHGEHCKCINNRFWSDGSVFTAYNCWGTHYQSDPPWEEWSENYNYDESNPPDCKGSMVNE